MPKDQWIRDVEAITEQWDDGELTLDQAVDRLHDIGMDPVDIRKTLDPFGFHNIPLFMCE